MRRTEEAWQEDESPPQSTSKQQREGAHKKTTRKLTKERDSVPVRRRGGKWQQYAPYLERKFNPGPAWTERQKAIQARQAPTAMAVEGSGDDLHASVGERRRNVKARLRLRIDDSEEDGPDSEGQVSVDAKTANEANDGLDGGSEHAHQLPAEMTSPERGAATALASMKGDSQTKTFAASVSATAQTDAAPLRQPYAQPMSHMKTAKAAAAKEPKVTESNQATSTAQGTGLGGKPLPERSRTPLSPPPPEPNLEATGQVAYQYSHRDAEGRKEDQMCSVVRAPAARAPSTLEQLIPEWGNTKPAERLRYHPRHVRTAADLSTMQQEHRQGGK